MNYKEMFLSLKVEYDRLRKRLTESSRQKLLVKVETLEAELRIYDQGAFSENKGKTFLGIAVEEYRIAKGLTVKKMAPLIGVTDVTYRKIIRGGSTLRGTTLFSIYDLLGEKHGPNGEGS